MNRTMNETYYQINTVLNNYLQSKGVSCPVLKYGVDPATIKTDHNNTSRPKYPYLQTHVTNAKQQSWTTRQSGILTKFDFQLSFFTGPRDEYLNDAKYFYPFELAKNALSDIELNLLDGVASLKATEGPYSFESKSGMAVPSAFVLYKMAAVCRYEAIIDPASISTELNAAAILEKK